MHYNCKWFKFGIMTFDLGCQIGIRFNSWAIRFPFFMPLTKATLLYSLRHQGLLKSLRHRFLVPPKEETDMALIRFSSLDHLSLADVSKAKAYAKANGSSGFDDSTRE